ncbi:MAG: STAS/SEC14 domain-containing protein, partial [Gammaproteobacteria bacterium]|nr:STAS/SEC14 domain-containing protein [Gammaproteobacteria bacterium]
MIVIEEQEELLKASIYTELSLADFREFEAAVNNELKRAPKIKLLLNLSKMSGYTLDVMWE